MKADIMLVSCSARQAKQSHLSPSQPTMRANRTSAEKTVPSTSARWAAGPTTDPAVYLRALIVDTLLVLYILPRLGYVWNGHRKTHALGNWLEFNRSKACFLLLRGPQIQTMFLTLIYCHNHFQLVNLKPYVFNANILYKCCYGFSLSHRLTSTSWRRSPQVPRHPTSWWGSLSS